MANVLHHHSISFRSHPVPSPLGFGFGLSSAGPSSMSSPGWASSQLEPGHTNPAAFHQLVSSITQSASSSRAQKRRLDPDDDSERSKSPARHDESMDRSPTPERPKRAAPKRARVASVQTTVSSEGDTKERKHSEDDHIDLGVLLASLPPQSLLPILTGLLKMQPDLRHVILPLIPRPTVEDAFDALKQAAKKLQDAMPFSNAPSSSLHYAFGAPQQPLMRDDYIRGRLRPHITDFVSTCLSYFPYFSFKDPSPAKQNSMVQMNATLQKEKFYPAETFAFLSNVTKLILAQPSLIVPELESVILPRLSEEWKLWLENLDRHINREGIMVSPSVARTWEVELERLGDGKVPSISRLMRDIARHFPLKQGWGIPSRVPSMMIES